MSAFSLCDYDGTYSLDVEDPAHQKIISNNLEKSRKKNYRELMFERINERRNNRRQFQRRIREEPRNQPVPALQEIIILSSDDDSDVMVTPAPNQLNTARIELTPEPAAGPRVSRNYAARGNMSNTSPKIILMRTRLGITMPVGAPGTMTASVNYTASAGDCEVMFVSSGAGLPVINSSPRAAKNTGSTAKAPVRCSSVPSSTSHAETATPDRTTDCTPSPGTRTAKYSVERRSLPNSLRTSFLSSEMNSVSSRITANQGEQVLMDESDRGEAPRNTAALLSRPRQTSATVPEDTSGRPLIHQVATDPMNTVHAKSSNGGVTNIFKPLPKAVRPSAFDTRHSRGPLLQITPPVPGNISNQQHTSHSRSVIDSHSSMLSTPTVQPRVVGNKTDGNCGEKPAQNSQPWQQKPTLPRQISLDRSLKVPMQTGISRPSSGSESTSSKIRSSSHQTRAPYRFATNNSMAPFSSQANRISRSAVRHAAPCRPLTWKSSIRGIEHSYGKQQPKAIEIPVKVNVPAENTSLPRTNQKMFASSQRADSHSPHEVVESYLTRKLSSTAPTRILFPSGRPRGRLGRARVIQPSSCAHPSLPSRNKMVKSFKSRANDLARALAQIGATSSRDSTLNLGRNPLRNNALSLIDGGESVLENAVPNRWNTPRSSKKHNLEAEEPPMKRLHCIATESPKSTAETAVEPGTSRTLSSSIMTKSNESNATPHPTVTPAVTTSHSLQSLVNMTASIQPALEGAEHVSTQITGTDPLGPIVSVYASSSESMLRLDQPLPPFESIGKFQSRIKECWDKPDPQDDAQSLRSEPNICVQKICEWLLNSSSEPLLPMLPSTTVDDSASAAILPPSRNDDIHNKDVQNYKQPAAPSSRGIGNCRSLMTPRTHPELSLAMSKPIQGTVCVPQISPNVTPSDEFIIQCDDGMGFKVSASVLDHASPYFKRITYKHPIDGKEYRVFKVTGVKYWIMQEILKFISSSSYNHSILRTTKAKRLLDMLEIQYHQERTFIFPVDPYREKILQ